MCCDFQEEREKFSASHVSTGGRRSAPKKEWHVSVDAWSKASHAEGSYTAPYDRWHAVVATHTIWPAFQPGGRSDPKPLFQLTRDPSGLNRIASRIGQGIAIAGHILVVVHMRETRVASAWRSVLGLFSPVCLPDFCLDSYFNNVFMWIGT